MKYIFLHCLLFVAFTTKAQVIDFQYWDTLDYSFGIFNSNETYFMDINNNGVIVGYFADMNGGRTAFVYLRNGKTIIYNHPTYSYTEFTGINDNGDIAGKAYNSAISALPIIGTYNSFTQTLGNFFASSFSNSAYDYRDPRKINNNKFIAGTYQNSVTIKRWLTYEEQQAPWTAWADIHLISGTQLNTYGMGLNDNMDICGFYIDNYNSPITFKPFIYNNNVFTDYGAANSGNPNYGTKYNDINNNKFLAVEFKDNSGLWQGAVGKINGSTATYQTSFPFHGAQGSAVTGINDNNDIVGYFKNSAGKVTAFYALANTEYKIDGFIIPDNVFPFRNDNAYFGYTNDYKYDYNGSDPYLKNTDNFIDKYFKGNNLLKSIVTSKKMDNAVLGTIDAHPSWPAYVQAVGEDSAYEVYSSVKQARQAKLFKWVLAADTFKGNCYGMSYFALQHFLGPIVLDNRFTGVPYVTKLKFLSNVSKNDSINIKQAIEALQIYQMGKHNAAQRNKENDFYDNKFNIVKQYDSMRTLIDSMTLHFYDDQLFAESLCGLGIKIDNVSQHGLHSVLPYKITKKFDLVNRIDTLYCLDPNLPASYLKIALDYANQTILGYDATNTLQYIIKDAVPSIKLVDQKISDKLQFKPNNSHQSSGTAKTTGSGTNLYYSTKCNLQIQNTLNVNEVFEINNNSTLKNYSGLNYFTQFNSDTIPDFAYSDSTLYIKSTLSTCDSIQYFAYEYNKGFMNYSKNNGQPNETEVVYNSPDYIKIENPDANTKYVSLGTIYYPATQESSVSIDSFKLLGSDTVSFTAINQNNFSINNGNDSNATYNVNVNFLGDTSYFNFSTTSIAITSNTSHIIQLQPDKPLQHVIILVDSLQDGSIDDTIKVVNTINGIHNIYKDVVAHIYPSPFGNELNITVKNIANGNYTINLMSVDGKLIVEQAANFVNGIFKLNTAKVAAGTYFLKITDANKLDVYHQKIVKQ